MTCKQKKFFSDRKFLVLNFKGLLLARFKKFTKLFYFHSPFHCALLELFCHHEEGVGLAVCGGVGAKIMHI
jgi:hypothetical protein